MHWGWLRLPPNGPDVCRGVSSLEMVVGRGRAACGIVSSISNWGLDGWMVEVAVEAEVADAQRTVWLTRENRCLRQSSHIDAERLRGVLGLRALRVSASVARVQPRILVESLDTGRVEVRAVTEAVRCCQSA